MTIERGKEEKSIEKLINNSDILGDMDFARLLQHIIPYFASIMIGIVLWKVNTGLDLAVTSTGMKLVAIA